VEGLEFIQACAAIDVYNAVRRKIDWICLIVTEYEIIICQLLKDR
jgi:hypothetical protein